MSAMHRQPQAARTYCRCACLTCSSRVQAASVAFWDAIQLSELQLRWETQSLWPAGDAGLGQF